MVNAFTKAMGGIIPKDKYVFMGLNMKSLNEVKGNIEIPIYCAGDIVVRVMNGEEIRSEIKLIIKENTFMITTYGILFKMYPQMKYIFLQN